MKLKSLQKPLFFALAAASLIPGVSPGTALVAGISFGLLLKSPFPEASSSWSRNLLQTAVIMLGFGLSLSEVLSQAWSSLPITVTGISLTIFLGYLLGTWLKIEPGLAKLISFGTAICGGSAIAAMAPAIKARDEETSVALATVFSLNSVALLIFPAIGKWLNMSQHDFGVWAGLAIHDTSSVVGAASHYGVTALAVATTVKLARALWITPFVVASSYFSGCKRANAFPMVYSRVYRRCTDKNSHSITRKSVAEPGINWPAVAYFIYVSHRNQIIAGNAQKGRPGANAARPSSLVLCKHFFIPGNRKNLKSACPDIEAITAHEQRQTTMQ